MPTVLDVARLAGVSSATVSRVLNGGSAVKPATQQKVLDAVKELDFQPDQMAQGLRRGKGSIVALLISDIQQGVNSALAKCLQNALTELGLQLMLFDLGHDERRLAEFFERAAPMRLNGLVFAVTDVIPLARIAPHLHRLAEQGVSVVAVSQRLDRHGIPSVVHEESAAVERSIDYLIERQLTPIAFLGRITGSLLGRERYRGYLKALKRHGIAADPSLIWDRAYRYQAGHQGIVDALASGARFRAVQCSSDEIALGAIAALQDAGRRVPDDVAVIGVGGVDWTPHVRPALTTLGSQPDQIAGWVQQIFRAYQDGRAAPRLSVVERPFVARGSA
ncbi:MAG: LacI family DNA-binding transcriptional regulator [Burkholderiaceae bacterium]